MQCFTSNYCSPDYADFYQMQDSLTAAFKVIADSLGDWIAPVGEAWRWIIQYDQVVLHSIDDSHPNVKGTYLASCVFYDVMFGKRSFGLSYYAGLADTALMFQYAADTIVFGSPSLWNLWNDEPLADFDPFISSDTLYTDNLSVNSSLWEWDFGDGGTSVEFEPVHIYSSPGEYKVTLTACDSCRCDTTARQIDIISSGLIYRQKDNGKIILTCPDESGNVSLKGFDGDGQLCLFDITGRLVKKVTVISGKTNIQSLSRGLWIWILKNARSENIDQGKFSW